MCSKKSKQHFKGPVNTSPSEKSLNIVVNTKHHLSEKQRHDLIEIVDYGIRHKVAVNSIKVHIMVSLRIYQLPTIIKLNSETVEVTI